MPWTSSSGRMMQSVAHCSGSAFALTETGQFDIVENRALRD
jgi:hypothetical protein